MRHGILSKLTLLPNESPENFDLLIKHYIDRFGVMDDVEFGFVEDMLNAYWRVRRCWTVENVALTEAIEAQPGNNPLHDLAAAFRQMSGGTLLPLLHRYETRFHNVMNRSLRNLLLLQKQNLPNEPSPIFEHSPEPVIDESTHVETVTSTEAAAPEPTADPVDLEAAVPPLASPAPGPAGRNGAGPGSVGLNGAATENRPHSSVAPESPGLHHQAENRDIVK